MIRTSKLERGRAFCLKLMVSPEPEAQAKAKQINVQDEVKRLAPSLAKLNWNAWMAIRAAIVGHFMFTKESLSEQKKTDLLMDVVAQSTCQTGISLSTTELSALCKDNLPTLGVLYDGDFCNTSLPRPSLTS